MAGHYDMRESIGLGRKWLWREIFVVHVHEGYIWNKVVQEKDRRKHGCLNWIAHVFRVITTKIYPEVVLNEQNKHYTDKKRDNEDDLADY